MVTDAVKKIDYKKLKISESVRDTFSNNEFLYLKLLKKFYIDTSYSGFIKSILINNKTDIIDYSYKLCSISASLGFQKLYNYSYKLIKYIRINKYDSVQLLVRNIENEYYRILTAIKEIYE